MDRRRRNVVLWGGGASTPPWYLSGNIASSDCVVAYQPKGAASLAASYINLANPGTSNCTAGVTPNWTIKSGWIFNVSEWLNTNYNPSGRNKNLSLAIRYTHLDNNFSVRALIGYYNTDTTTLDIVLSRFASQYFSSGYVNNGVAAVSATLIISGDKVYINGVDSYTIAAGSNLGNHNIYIGDDGLSRPMMGCVESVAIYHSVLDATQVAALHTGMLSLDSDAPRTIVFDGDSITTGQGANPGYNYPATLMRYEPITYTKYVDAVVGQTVAQMLTATDVDAHYSAGAILCALGGINDCYVGTDATIIYNNLVTYHQARRAVGFKTIAMTIFPAGTVTAAKETVRQAVNASLLSNWATFADGIVDLAADARLSNPADTTYFNADTVHLTDAGYFVVSQLVRPVLDGLL